MAAIIQSGGIDGFGKVIPEGTVLVVGVFSTTILNLPSAVGLTGTTFLIKNRGTGNVTVIALSGESIEDDSSTTLLPQTAMTIQSTGAGWIIV